MWQPIPCANCGVRQGTVVWGDLLAVTHGGAQMWCNICALTKQIEYAEERAADLPRLRAALAAELEAAELEAENETTT